MQIVSFLTRWLIYFFFQLSPPISSNLSLLVGALSNGNKIVSFYNLHCLIDLIILQKDIKIRDPFIVIYEPSHGKTNNVVSEQV